MFTRLTVLALVIVALGCGGSYGGSTSSGNTTTTVEATLSSIQTNIFTPTCATSGCHSASSATNGLSLAAGDSFTNLVGIPSQEVATVNRVTAGNPSQSYLVNKLEGTQTSVGGSGAQMPRNGSPLGSAEIQAIKDWITNGAQNN